MLCFVGSILRIVTSQRLVNQISFQNLYKKSKHVSTVQLWLISIYAKDASRKDNKFILRKGNKFSKWTKSTMIIGKNVWIAKDQIMIKFYVEMRTAPFFIEELKWEMISRKRKNNMKGSDGNFELWYVDHRFIYF